MWNHPCHQLRGLLVLLLFVAPAAQGASRWPRPSLSLVKQVLVSTAHQEFDSDAAFEAAAEWHGERLSRSPSRQAPHLACTDYSKGSRALRKLEAFLPSGSVRKVSNHKLHGACFIVTAAAPTAAAMKDHLRDYDLTSFGPIPATLKLAPELLDHDGHPLDEEGRLATTHGKRMRFDSVGGLDVALSPGALASGEGADTFIVELKEGLMSGSIDLHRNNFWSDAQGDHSSRAAGAVRTREWKRAAWVVHGLSNADGEGPAPGDVCSWGGLRVHYAGSDVLYITGMDHLLHQGRGAGGSTGAESDELQMACFMGLVSYLAGLPEVQRVSPFHESRLLNAVAGAIVQSGNIVDRPLTDAGLDGTGEVIQIVDSGLDETSCFFEDESGEEVEHGYYFNDIEVVGVESSALSTDFRGGSFPIDLTRRKIVQYTRLVSATSTVTQSSSVGGQAFTESEYYYFSGFGQDMLDGHGTHTAGSAAGAVLNSPAETDTCSSDENLGCIGTCLSALEEASLLPDGTAMWDTLCPQFGCDATAGDTCLGADVGETLTENGGVAQGAKISVFDASVDGLLVWASLALNGLWESTDGTDSFVHSNSWGSDNDCNVDSQSVAYDEYMYENPEHLLLFAAGNMGLPDDPDRKTCTINNPGGGKNVLTVGASSSGPTRISFSNDDGGQRYSSSEPGGIDVVAFFSSYGLMRDGRIKPDVVAPGDQVLSAGSDGSDGHSCQLSAQSGTSMSTPLVAGSAALIRQYFKNESFYAADVNSRGLCGEIFNATNTFACEAFSPSSATLKAMFVNSADLMGESSEPDGVRGFGRVHLEAGMPLGGQDNQALFVADASVTTLDEYTIDEYHFEMASGAELELRATLAWIDPPASAESSTQLINDLDLTLVGPDGTLYRMFSDGADDRNVIERVIVPADTVSGGSGNWTVAVSSFGLTTGTQDYSLVVTGPIDEGSGAKTTRETSGSAGGKGPGVALLFSAAIAVALFVAQMV